MSSRPSLSNLLDLQYPIVQAPMAGVATPELAAAVSNAGALGSMGCGSSSVEKTQQMIAAARALTDHPFNVNFFCHRTAVTDAQREAAWLDYLRPYFNEFNAPAPDALNLPYKSFNEDCTMLDMLLQERPAVVSFIFGLPPKQWIEQLRNTGIVTMACATTLDEAKKAEAAGIDAIVAQGAEAGGHRGVFNPGQGDLRLGTFALTRLVSNYTELPVIAAGGIMDGQGIRAAQQLGAAGAQLGTAFILCPESSAKDAHRTALKSNRSWRTEITDVISGRPARGIINRMHTDIARGAAPALPDYPLVYDAGKALAAAATGQGSSDFSAHWAGQGAPLAREMPAADLVRTLVKEWRKEA